MHSLPERIHTVPAPPKQVFASVTDYYRRSQDPIRFIQRKPLPTTFKLGETIASYRQENEAALSEDPAKYPFTYFRVSLTRGLIGLEKKAYSIVYSLGLHVVGQVVYKRVCPETAGKILSVKELVTVKLVNTIPPIYRAVSGFTKVDNIIGKGLIKSTV